MCGSITILIKLKGNREVKQVMIERAVLEDVDYVFKLYDLATAYQKMKSDRSWNGFERELIENEISENRLWKIVDNSEIACVFSISFSDELIWGEKDKDPSIYLHRIATNPDFRGKGYVKTIIEWAKKYALANGLKYIRLDTFGDNHALIDYYIKCGFKFLGLTSPKNTNELPKHYEGISLSLFEIEV